MRTATAGGTVLIIDGDESIRRVMAVVLRRAGFSVRTASSFETAAGVLERVRIDAIVRDVSLAPRDRKESLRQLAATAPDVLRRTIVATTSPVEGIDLPDVFAVIRKPFEIGELVRVVSACAPRKGEEHVSLEALQRFVSSVPSLQRVLADQASSSYEMLLRAEMQRAMRELSAVLDHAAGVEVNPTRAAALLAAAAVAAGLAERRRRGAALQPSAGH